MNNVCILCLLSPRVRYEKILMTQRNLVIVRLSSFNLYDTVATSHWTNRKASPSTIKPSSMAKWNPFGKVGDSNA